MISIFGNDSRLILTMIEVPKAVCLVSILQIFHKQHSETADAYIMAPNSQNVSRNSSYPAMRLATWTDKLDLVLNDFLACVRRCGVKRCLLPFSFLFLFLLSSLFLIQYIREAVFTWFNVSVCMGMRAQSSFSSVLV